MTELIATVVSACCRAAWLTVLGFFVLAGAAAHYSITHFAITTDSSRLISAKLPWRQRELALDHAFPQRSDLIVVVVDGPTPELADAAASELARELERQPETIRRVGRPDADRFFEQNGLLFLSQHELDEEIEGLIRAQPFLAALAADPSLRGLAHILQRVAGALAAGDAEPRDFAAQLSLLTATFERLLEGEQGRLALVELLRGTPPSERELRRILEVKPVLDYAALEPGAKASSAIRDSAAKLKLASRLGARVRLTGSVPMADEEFATIAEGAALNGALTILCVLCLTWLALRSARLILAVFVSLFAGFLITAAAGLAVVGAFNLISVAFAMLFVGIGIDFGIQFAVRYRAERYAFGGLAAALRSTAQAAGVPLAIAAAATMAGFFAFLPTDYRGVSELGLIAGMGMGIAFFTTITLLPALLTLLKPPGEPSPIGYRWLGPVDRAFVRFRLPILVLTGLAVGAGLPLLLEVNFDFNPLNLRSSQVESVATMLELTRDKDAPGNNVDILAPSAAAAASLGARLAELPEVASVTSLASFIPSGQTEKLRRIGEAAELLGPTLLSQATQGADDAASREALELAAQAFDELASRRDDAGPSRRLARQLRRLAEATPEVRAHAEASLLPGLAYGIEKIKTALRPMQVSLATLPTELVAEWLTPDGRARLEVAPRGDPNDNETLRRFARAVLAVAPEATGVPILIQESAGTVVQAFAEAGLLALVSITLILFAVLRRASDVGYTLLPLLLAAVVTLELTALFGLKLNFANIIALPLLLGVGVAFKIYYVLAWRAGEPSLLASPLTRAVFFSAMTTGSAFGSLFMSSHPGTSSMGKLLCLALLTTLIAAVVFQPILMGPPRPRRGAAACRGSRAARVIRENIKQNP
jgi:hopanoid biosynthesis associated RND transporter like protein HpnN